MKIKVIGYKYATTCIRHFVATPQISLTYAHLSQLDNIDKCIFLLYNIQV